MHSVCCRKIVALKQFSNIYIFITSACHGTTKLTCNTFMLCKNEKWLMLGCSNNHDIILTITLFNTLD